jgi:hypothetical protein
MFGGNLLMEIQEAILAYSQSEKIKSGLIWVSQTLTVLNGLAEPEKPGADKIIQTMLDLIANEVHLSRKLTHEVGWAEIEKHIDTALVMIRSNVAHESIYNLTQALSQVTDIAQRSMSFLKAEGLL